jgi:hypothetical protein
MAEIQLNNVPIINATPPAVEYLKSELAAGKHWFLALLEAIGLWEIPAEVYNGRTYCYLIADEAFDWLLLAQRLCESIDGLIPQEEKDNLIFHGKPPIEVSPDKFKNYIGVLKYQQYLNYFYGITVEEALIQAVRDEVRKERHVFGYREEEEHDDEVFRRIYGAGRMELLKSFRSERGHPQQRSISLTELKEFTYWLFKYRVKKCDRARVASDTKKGLKRLTASGYPDKFTARRQRVYATPIIQSESLSLDGRG